MERTQKEWFSIFGYHRQILIEKLALLLRFERFLQKLPIEEFILDQQAIMATDIARTRDALAHLEKFQQEAAEERLVLGIPDFDSKRRKKSCNRCH